VSFRDITHNPDVIRALRELSKRGIYGKLEKVRDNYGVILFDVKATGEYIMNEVKEKWTESYYDQENRTIVFHINIPEHAAIPVPAEERDRAAKSLQDKLRRRGIRSYIEVVSDREAYITIDLDSVAKYIDKNFRSVVTNNARYFSYYDAENTVLQVHVWTGPTPKEVQKLKEEAEKA